MAPHRMRALFHVACILDAFTIYEKRFEQKYSFLMCYVRYIIWVTFQNGYCDELIL